MCTCTLQITILVFQVKFPGLDIHLNMEKCYMHYAYLGL